MCVQRFDDSQCSAIHTTFRASLRSSSMREPRDPLLKVFRLYFRFRHRLYGIKAAPERRSTLCFHGFEESKALGHSLMIPPQVHLRRPCYDFYFL
jgi:hypothetical protein